MELEGPDLHLILAQQFQMGYTKAYDKDLHKVPNNILHRYALPSISNGIIYSTLLYIKQLEQFRHFYLVSKHLSLSNAIVKLQTQLDHTVQQNLNLSSQMSTMTNEFKQLQLSVHTQHSSNVQALINHFLPAEPDDRPLDCSVLPLYQRLPSYTNIENIA